MKWLAGVTFCFLCAVAWGQVASTRPIAGLSARPDAEVDVLAITSPLPVQPIVRATVPERPSKVDKGFLAMAAIATATTILDVEVTAHCVHSVAGCHESNFLYGSDPTRARLYAVNAPVLGTELLLSRWLKRKYPDRKLWMVPALSLSVGHIVGAAPGFRTF